MNLVTVFGGSGFLGRHVVTRLVRRGMAVRVAVRHPRAPEDGPGTAPGAELAASNVDSVAADVRDEQQVRAALAGARGAINVVGHYVESRGASFVDVHVTGAERVARLAAGQGVERLVHLSGIGVDCASPSAYVRARAQGEARVRASFPQAAVLRPSALFGRGDALLEGLDAITRATPIFPLFGSGSVRIQPAFVEDVAEAAARALESPSARGRVFELGGPAVYSYRELVRLVLSHRHRRRALLPVPLGLWALGAGVLSLLPGAPITRDQVVLMSRDNVAAASSPGFEELGIAPRSIPELLDEILPSAR